MRAENFPLADKGWSLQPKANQGAGIALGQEAGGVFVQENFANGIWGPQSAYVAKDGAVVNFPHMIDRCRPGFIMVNTAGKRFVNESMSYQLMGNFMNEHDVDRAFLVGSRQVVRKYGLGMALPFPMPIGKYVRSGYLKYGRTIKELADELKVDANTLETTVSAFDVQAATGVDPEFQRGENAYDRALGDRSHKPNPVLGPLGKGPYYAVEIRRGEFSTCNGLDTNSNAQVLDRSGVPIAGLYAVGIDANSWFRGAYPGGGASNGMGMTCAYIAACHAAS